MWILSLLLSLYWLVLLGRIVMDLILSLTGGRGLSGLAILNGILYELTEPVLRPIRRLLPPLRVGAVALDLSPLIVFVLIALLRQVVSTS
ncbi:MAG: YggT family protein [Actinomycetes bacterium]